jgi:hypothetical protein
MLAGKAYFPNGQADTGFLSAIKHNIYIKGIRDDMESTIGDQLRGNFCTFKVGHQCPEGLSNVHFVIVRSIFLFFVLPNRGSILLPDIRTC